MYNHVSKSELNSRKTEQQHIRRYNLMSCFCNDYLIKKTTHHSRISKNLYKYSRLYYHTEHKTYFSFTKLFLDVSNDMIEDRKNRDFDKIFLDAILDKISKMIKNKVIITRMTFLDDKIINNPLEKYNKLLVDIVINKNKYENIVGVSSDTIYNFFSNNDIIDCYDSIEFFVDLTKKEYEKYSTKKDYMAYSLDDDND